MGELAPNEGHKALWWNASAGRWVEIDWHAFARIRGVPRMSAALGLDYSYGDQSLPDIPPGDHFFIACVMS